MGRFLGNDELYVFSHWSSAFLQYTPVLWVNFFLIFPWFLFQKVKRNWLRPFNFSLGEVCYRTLGVCVYEASWVSHGEKNHTLFEKKKFKSSPFKFSYSSLMFNEQLFVYEKAYTNHFLHLFFFCYVGLLIKARYFSN